MGVTRTVGGQGQERAVLRTIWIADRLAAKMIVEGFALARVDEIRQQDLAVTVQFGPSSIRANVTELRAKPGNSRGDLRARSKAGNGRNASV